MEETSTWLAHYGFRLLGAAVILLAGLWLARLLTGFLRRLLTTREVEPTLVNFGCNLTYAGLIAFAVLATMSQIGIQTASFITVLGAAGLAIGLALQNSLSNFAAGVMILVFRPFKVDDVVEAAGVIGVVEDLHIFTTQLRTGDNKTVFIPNGKLLGDNIINYSRKGTRRLDLVIGVSYDDNVRRVKEVLTELLREDGRILAEPAPTVAVLAFADSSVNFAVRPWVKIEDYWNVHFDTLEHIKQRFDAEGITIPFPQRDVHMIPPPAKPAA